MKKCIYYGPSKDFWWHTRFRKFMDGLDYIELLSEEYPMLQKSPIVLYSHQHDVSIQYQMENTICPPVVTGNEPFVQRARVTLYGEESNIRVLEIIIRAEAYRIQGKDNIREG